METFFLILAIGFSIIMVVMLFKYANFIHHFPNSNNMEKDNEKESSNHSDENHQK